MEDLRYRFLRQDREIHNKYYDRKTALNLVINSKDEIIVSHRYKIQFYSSELYILQNEITLKNKVRDILLIEEDLLVVTKYGEFIKFKRETDFEYSIINRKIIDKDIDFRYMIKLDKKNLICAFCKTDIYIINIDSFSIDCRLSLPCELYIDARTKPFILSDKNYIICFRQTTILTIFNYKKMKIIKTIDLRKDSPFQLYKDEKDNFFYIISMVFTLKNKNLFNTHIKVTKYDLNLNILEISKIKMFMPNYYSYSFDDQDIEEVHSFKTEGIHYYDHYCIYRCIVQDIKNYSFILHEYRGPPNEEELFFLVECKNGKIKSIKKTKYQYINSDSYVDYVYMKYKDKIISAYAGKYDDTITLQP